jgi:L-threonine-O-3-phosphate decarboxylase
LAHQSFNTRPVHGGNIVWAAQVANCSPFEILDFSASISPLGPPASAIAAMQASLAALTRYPDPRYAALSQAIAAHHALAPPWVMPGNGAAELLTWAGRDLAALDATYGIVPAFGDYRRSLNAFQGTWVPCPLPLDLAETGQVDWSALIMANLRHAPERCGLVLNTPHNPTGLVIPPEAIAPLLERFALVVVDEAFMDFLPPSEACSVVAWVTTHPNLVVLRSLTKFYSLPGLRLGYALAHPDRLARWQGWRDPWPVNALAEAAAIAVLSDTTYQRATWQWLAEARSRLYAQLQALPTLHPLPGRANYLLIRTERPGSALQQDLLKRDRILVRDCLSFPDLGEDYIRVAVRTVDDNDRLVAALTDSL